MRMRELAQARPRYGYRRLHVLLRRDGWAVNMKRVRRLYRLEGLQLRHRVRRRKHASLHRGIPPAASRAHERWSMDFVHDALADGRAFRVLTVVDQLSRWSPILEMAQSLSGSAVAEALDRAIAKHGKPQRITVDHGTEFTSRVLDEWAYQRGVLLDFIRAGKPVENCFIEFFNGKLRDECLNANQGQKPRGVLGQRNDGDDCAAFFPEINRTKAGPSSVALTRRMSAVRPVSSHQLNQSLKCAKLTPSGVKRLIAAQDDTEATGSSEGAFQRFLGFLRTPDWPTGDFGRLAVFGPEGITKRRASRRSSLRSLRVIFDSRTSTVECGA